MDRLLTNRTSAWFLWAFGKEQPSMTALQKGKPYATTEDS